MKEPSLHKIEMLKHYDCKSSDIMKQCVTRYLFYVTFETKESFPTLSHIKNVNCNTKLIQASANQLMCLDPYVNVKHVKLVMIAKKTQTCFKL